MRRIIPLFAGLVLAGSSFAHADPIRVGSLTWAPDSPAAIHLQADGFTFDGQAVPVLGVFAPLACVFGPCRPGAAMDLEARWLGSDLPGTARVGDIAAFELGSVTSPAQLDAHWLGSLTAAAGRVSAPFAFEGAFWQQEGGVLDLAGTGVATATFTRQAGALALSRLEYVFGADATPTPEPGTWLLLATGLLGALVATRRRTTHTHGGLTQWTSSSAV